MQVLLLLFFSLQSLVFFSPFLRTYFSTLKSESELHRKRDLCLSDLLILCLHVSVLKGNADIILSFYGIKDEFIQLGIIVRA